MRMAKSIDLHPQESELNSWDAKRTRPSKNIECYLSKKSMIFGYSYHDDQKNKN